MLKIQGNNSKIRLWEFRLHKIFIKTMCSPSRSPLTNQEVVVKKEKELLEESKGHE